MEGDDYMRKALVVVDYQNDCVSGSIGFTDAKELERRIQRKIVMYRKNDYDIVFTFDTHDDGYMSTMESRYTPVKHCIKGTAGWNLYGLVAKTFNSKDKAFCKSAFGSMELANYLKHNNYKIVEFVGVPSSICVLANAVLAKSALPEANIIIDASCTASRDRVLNEEAFDIMEEMQMKVENRDNVVG